MQISRTHPATGRRTVLVISITVSAAVVLWGTTAPTSFEDVATRLFNSVVSDLSWFFLLAANLFLVFVGYLGLSRYGRIKLGNKSDEPEFSRFSWFAMMFQAGMGPALIFWGLAERAVFLTFHRHLTSNVFP